MRLEENTLLTDMKKNEVLKILKKDLDAIPFIKGVSNHMGSKATEDKRLMGIIFDELKKRKLYFLDSLVSSKSICSKLANKAKIGIIKRDIFLDNNSDYSYIETQLNKLKHRAHSRGYAVGVGHDRKIHRRLSVRIIHQAFFVR